MQTAKRACILCVDDEPNVLEGLALHLRKRFDVYTAAGGAAALDILQQHRTISVIMSDMRMPGMDGATFLAQARTLVPDATRLLLTGQTDLNSAIAAVNEGQIFRFLTKPCPPTDLLKAVNAAFEQYQLITAERELLEKTLHGSIQTLVDVLSLTNPAAFGRSTRIKNHVSTLAARLQLTECWQVEVAAMLSQLGCITLPTETVEKIASAQPLNEKEQAMVARVPALTEQLLGHIPRLEFTRAILTHYTKSYTAFTAVDKAIPERQRLMRCAQILKIAVDFDALDAQGTPTTLALDIIRKHAAEYEPEVLQALLDIFSSEGPQVEVREITVAALRVGMVLAEDVHTLNGALLATRGYAVTTGFVERIRNHPAAVKWPMRVIELEAPPAAEEGTA